MDIPHRVRQSLKLALAGADHRFIRVSCRRHPEGSGEVEVTPALCVPNVTVPGALPNDRPGPVGIGERHVGGLEFSEEIEDHAGLRCRAELFQTDLAFNEAERPAKI
jgi:hypothetical protein